MAVLSAERIAKIETRVDWILTTVANMTAQGVDEYEINGRRVKKVRLEKELDYWLGLLGRASTTRAVNLAQLKRR